MAAPTLRQMASIKNWMKMSASSAPMAFFSPISRVRDLTAVIMPFQMPKPPRVIVAMMAK